jgi:hypothetical protein
MKQEFALIVAHLRRLGCGLPDRLAKGTLVKGLAWFPHPLPPPIVEWWELANGPVWGTADVAEDVWLKPGYYPLSLEEAEEDYADNADRFEDSWLPIMTDGGGDFLVVDCADETCPVLICSADDETERIYDSLELMLKTLEECFAAGIYAIDSDGHFESDDDTEAELASKLNPNSHYWLDFL